MALRRKVHHRVGLMRREDLPHRGGIGDIGADQHVAAVPACLLQRLLRRGIGHLVDIDRHVVAVANQVACHRRTDEAASARQQEFHPPVRAPDTKNRHCPVRWDRLSGLCRFRARM